MNISFICVIAGGILNFLIFLFHTRFYSFFRWKAEFSKITLTNRRIFYTIHLALIVFLFGLTVITLIFAKELSSGTGLAGAIDLLMVVFWLWRGIWQVVYFKPPAGVKPSSIHYIVTLVSALCVICYTIPIL